MSTITGFVYRSQETLDAEDHQDAARGSEGERFRRAVVEEGRECLDHLLILSKQGLACCILLLLEAQLAGHEKTWPQCGPPDDPSPPVTTHPETVDLETV